MKSNARLIEFFKYIKYISHHYHQQQDIDQSIKDKEIEGHNYKDVV